MKETLAKFFSKQGRVGMSSLEVQNMGFELFESIVSLALQTQMRYWEILGSHSMNGNKKTRLRLRRT